MWREKWVNEGINENWRYKIQYKKNRISWRDTILEFVDTPTVIEISRLGFSSRNWAKDYEVIDRGPRESPPVAWPFARECVACMRGESEFQPACRQAYTRVPYSTRNQSYQPCIVAIFLDVQKVSTGKIVLLIFLLLFPIFFELKKIFHLIFSRRMIRRIFFSNFISFRKRFSKFQT